jgi:hypothetical protein
LCYLELPRWTRTRGSESHAVCRIFHVDVCPQILGQGLTGTNAVTFNGVPATSFTVVSDTFMTAVVPSGATTGRVVVTSPGGALTSNVSFRIIN